jgi:hypothetical protein
MRKFSLLLTVTLLFAFSSTAFAATLPDNFDPNPGTLVDLSTPVDFKWNGPGESQYEFVQYMICFEEVNGPSYVCFNADTSNHKTMSLNDWKIIDAEMAHLSGNVIDLNWYVQSWFRDSADSSNEELLTSQSWNVSYDREQLDMDSTAYSGYEDIEQQNVSDGYAKVEILDYFEGENSIALELVNQNLELGDYYFAECVNQEQVEDSFDDLRYKSMEQPVNSENYSSVQLMVGPLDPGTEYGCYAAIKTPATIAGQYSIINHSDWIYTSTLEGAEETVVDFELPPAGYEDEVITKIDQFKNPFPDTDMLTLEGQAAAELYRRAIIGGYPDGEFKGFRLVNRAEAAKFLLLSKFESVDEIQNNGQFPDVLEGEWYVKYVVTAAIKNIINGYPDGYFRPANPVNTAEFLKMLTLTFGLEENLPYDYEDVSDTDWFAKYAGVAQKYDLFPERTTYLNPGTKLTRDDVAVAIYQYLSNR